jgi:hypothetical protein
VSSTLAGTGLPFTDGSIDPGSDAGVAFFLGYGDIPTATLESLISSDITAFQTGAPVPEPSTWAMMLLGFAGLGFAGYRASRRTTAPGLRA